MTVDARFYEAQLARVVAGRRWLVAMDHAVAGAALSRTLLDLGAAGCFVLAGSRGTGELADVADSPLVVLDVRAKTTMESIRAMELAFAELPPDVRAKIDAWDPEGRAWVLRPPFSTGSDVAGRRVFGRRPQSWQRLEDKVVIDAVWQANDVVCAPFEVAPAELGQLVAAAARIDQGQGTVWAGDATEGFNGGAEYTHWVTDSEEAERAANFLGEHCETARVMPFLEGTPCSIHGLVFDEQVIALRPCEMVVLRDLDAHRFVYARAATFWEPPEPDVRHMRSLAKKVGGWLRANHDYRGAFTIDGVLTADGFLPTELNPRYGAALQVLSAGISGLNLILLNFALIEGCDFDWQPSALEVLIRTHAKANPAGGGSGSPRRKITEQLEVGVTREGDGWREVAQGEPADATIRLGPAAVGGYLRIVLDPERTPRGPAVAGLVAELLGWANDHWTLDLPPLVAAIEVGVQRRGAEAPGRREARAGCSGVVREGLE